MDDVTRDDVEEVVFGFMQRCFIGAAPKGEAMPQETEWVRLALRNSDSLSPAEVASWGAGKQLALYELLRDTLICLRLRPDARFPPDELADSSTELLSQPLLSGIGSTPILRPR